MKKNYVINLYDIFIKLIIMLLVSTIFHNFTVIIHLNDIIVTLNMIIIIILFINNMRRKDILFIISILILDIFSIINTPNYAVLLEHIIHINVALLLSYSLLNIKILEGLQTAINNNERLIKYAVYVSIITTAPTLLMPMFYSYSSGELIYNGFAGQHYLASGLCLCMVLYLIFLKNKQFKFIYLLYLLIIVIAIFKTGARSFLIPVIILVFLYIIRIKIKSIKPFIVLGIIITLFFSFINSSGFTRFASAASNKFVTQTRLEAMSNGRLVWWKYDLEAYKYSNIYNKIFGNGYELINHINKTRYGLNIWAHNDFIQILVSSGIYGLAVYLYYLFKPKSILKKNSGTLAMWIWLFYIVFEGFVNGYYNYICFAYSSFILFIYLYYEKDERSKKNENIIC